MCSTLEIFEAILYPIFYVVSSKEFPMLESLFVDFGV